MVRVVLLIALFGGVALSTGCLATANLWQEKPDIYGGTYQDLTVAGQCVGETVGLAEPAPCFGEPLNAGGRVFVGSLCILDTPLSFVVDTVTLPYALYCQWTGGTSRPTEIDGLFPSVK